MAWVFGNEIPPLIADDVLQPAQLRRTGPRSQRMPDVPADRSTVTVRAVVQVRFARPYAGLEIGNCFGQLWRTQAEFFGAAPDPLISSRYRCCSARVPPALLCSDTEDFLQ